MFKNSKTEYGLISKAVHWIMALLVFFVFFLGESFDFIERGDPINYTVHFLHFGVSIFIFAFLVFRLIWLVISPKPKPISTHKKREVVLAKISHYLIYFLLFALILSGYIVKVADGDSLNVLNIFHIPSLIQIDSRGIVVNIMKFHRFISHVLAFFVVLHILGALKHHFYDKDNTLRRMIGGKKRN